MKIKVSDIEKYDKIVRGRYQTAVMHKINDSSLTWTDGYRIVASLTIKEGCAIFNFEE